MKHLTILCICGTLIFFALALGPSPLEKGCFLNKIAPYNILLKVNLLRQLRIPIRFAIVGTLSFYLLAALGIKRCLETDKGQFRVKKLFSVIIIGLQVIEFMPGKYPLYKMETEQIYKEISSQSPPHRPILILPLGWSNGYKTYGADPRPIQYTQTVHERPIFQGHISRLQDSFFDFYLSDAGFKCLMNEDIDLEDQATTEQVFNLIDRFDVKDIIIYQKYYTKRHLNSLLKLFVRHPGRLRISLIE